MTREEAIEIIQDMMNVVQTVGSAYVYKHNGGYERLRGILDILSVSREQELEAENKELKERIVNWRKYMAPTREQVELTQPGKPLTLDQLREMDGKPAWCEEVGKWALVSVSDAGKLKGIPFALFVKDGGRFEWDIEDRNLSLYSYSPEQVGRERWSGCLICRGTKYMYGDAVSGYGTREVRGGVVFHYCPMCGRPLTEEAWVELERRLRG